MPSNCRQKKQFLCKIKTKQKNIVGDGSYEAELLLNTMCIGIHLQQHRLTAQERGSHMSRAEIQWIKRILLDPSFVT